MKNKKLLKTLLLILVVVVGLTWLLPGTTNNQETGKLVLDTVKPEGLLGVFGSLDIVGQYFFQNILIILVIGMFYGVINKTGAYKELVEDIANKFKKNKEIFLILSFVFFILIPALTNIYFLMFLFVPFFMNVLKEMGYSKNVMLLSTVGAILIGYSSQLMNSIFLKTISATDNPYIWVKLAFLVIASTLTVLFTLKFPDKEKDKEDSMLELEKRTGKKAKNNSKPLMIVLIVLVVLFFLGFVTWNFAFFDKMHEAIMGVKIGQYTIFANLFGKFNAFGKWWTGELYTMLALAAVLVGFLYRLSFDEFVDGLVEGVKKFIVPAVLVGMMVLITIFTINSGFVGTILNFIVSSGNAALVTLGTMIGIPFIADPNYVSNYSMPLVLSAIAGPNNQQIAFITQLTYGITMLVAPTSAIMVVGMAYLEKDYKSWFKYVWKLVAVLVALVFIAVVITSLIK